VPSRRPTRRTATLLTLAAVLATGSGCSTTDTATPAADVTRAAGETGKQVSATAKKVAAAYGKNAYDQAIQIADTYAQASYGDCNRLNGKKAGTLQQVYDKSGLKNLVDKAPLPSLPQGTKFPQAGCAKVGVTAWDVTVDNGKTPTVWVSGTVRTQLFPIGAKGIEVSQPVKLGLTRETTGTAGWKVSTATNGKLTTKTITR
jgi:hypothetical protein